ncbi:mannose-6-phosphate isomerase, class I [Demequina capsici]|uniref:mannose-6-phosphate isomerase n=1 Tax=Demequina capsici TaxID=3075620 RepID=A0AA96F6F8_9MICO|nr:mannose-6-phosphate isomerase, class I [Demequina sp. OYTSA14]WNM24966.1 mannose-6-phosphate isomerase, class I [Demequina sp. OYTSA14]
MYALTPALQPYDWGDAETIPHMLGTPVTGEPVAEAWWGAHTSAPAIATGSEGVSRGLDEVIAEDPVRALGPEVAQAYGGVLPFLLKVLAIRKPLSLQVHPHADQAAAGFAREQELGVPLDAAARLFKDPRPKPELVVALTPLVVLTGFRPVAALRADLAFMDADGARVLEGVLDDADDDDDAISEYIDTCLRGIQPMPVLVSMKAAVAAGHGSASMHIAADALDAHPGDAGALVALAMNAVTLAPGEAAYTGAGIVHSYQRGVGLEIMANSDNVIRAGLTHKPMDLGQLLYLAHTSPSDPVLPAVDVEGAVTRFSTLAPEFALSLLRRGAIVAPPGPRIVLAVEGTTTVVAGGRTAVLAAGEAVFIAHAEGSAAIETGGMTAVASTPAR